MFHAAWIRLGRPGPLRLLLPFGRIISIAFLIIAGEAVISKRGATMKTLISTCAIVLLMAGSAAAGEKMMKEQDLIDLEMAWSKATVQKDVAAVSAVLADDWVGQNDSGKPMDKTRFLAELQSGKMSATSMMNHDVHARVMHGMGIVQGMDDEKSSYKGKDTSGTYSWTDVFEMRDGKWQAVASQVTKVK